MPATGAKRAAAQVRTSSEWTHDPWVKAAHGYTEGIRDAAPLPAKPPGRRRPAPGPAGEPGVEHVHLRAGDMLTVSASSTDPIELVVDSEVRGVVAEQTGQTPRVAHVASADC